MQRSTAARSTKGALNSITEVAPPHSSFVSRGPCHPRRKKHGNPSCRAPTGKEPQENTQVYHRPKALGEQRTALKASTAVVHFTHWQGEKYQGWQNPPRQVRTMLGRICCFAKKSCSLPEWYPRCKLSTPIATSNRTLFNPFRVGSHQRPGWRDPWHPYRSERGNTLRPRPSIAPTAHKWSCMLALGAIMGSKKRIHVSTSNW